MPLSKDSDLDIDSLLDEQLGSSDMSRPNINRASHFDPDQQAEVITLAESRKVDPQTVEDNLGEFQRRSKVEAIDTRGYPKLSQYLSDDRNSRVSVDDIDNLKGIEGAVRESENGFWSNIGRGTLNRVNTLTGNMIEFTGNVGKNFGDYLGEKGIPNPGIVIGEDGVSWSWDIPDEAGNLLKNVGKAVSEGDGYGYKPRFTWEKFKGDMNPKTLAGYIAEQGVQSVPDMMAAIFTLPAYVTSRTEEIAEERVKNDERKDVTGQDLATSLIPAVTVSLIERLAGKVTLGVGGVTTGKQAIQATGAAALTEGGTEFIQEGIEYLGETVGTKKDVSVAEMIDRQLAGLVAGSGMGASIRGATSSFEALSSRAERNVEDVIMSTGEQEVIDQITTFAQASTTRGRKEDRFRNFLKGLETDKQVFISSDAVIEAVQNGVVLPSYMTEQLDGLGSDITVDMEQFGADVAPNEEAMAALRPHMKLSNESLTPSQLEAEDDFSIQALLERAEKSKAALTEAETIYEEVKQQLVDTGRQSEATARYSAAILPAYVTVKAEQAGKPVREIYEMMGLSIVGPATKVGEVEVSEQQELDQSTLKSVDLIDFSNQDLAVKMVELDSGTPLFNEFDAEEFPHVNLIKEESGKSPVLGFQNRIRNSYVMADGTVYRVNQKTSNITKVDEFEARDFLKNKIFSAQRKAEPTVEETKVEEVQEQIQEAAVNIEITDRKAADINSKEFKGWFDESVATNEDGSPLIVYHGTRAAVDDSFVFDYSRIGQQGRAEGAGFYFTPNKGVADGYADNGATLEVYLSIQKPIDYNQKGFKKTQLKKIIKTIAKAEAKRDDSTVADGFLSNYGDVNYEGIDSVVSEAVNGMINDTAIDQLSGMVGSGVDVDIVNRATQQVTGHDGFVSKGFSGKGGDSDPLIYVSFFPEQIKSVQNLGGFDPKSPDIYHQPAQSDVDEDLKRGAILIGDDSMIIKMHKASDLSTFLHESGHLFLEMEGKFAELNGVTPDQQTILDFLEMDSFEDISVDQHEKFAETFEVYLREGKAPSLALRDAFAAFKRWLVRIYQNLTDQRLERAELTPEITEVFDRLLATEAEIELATANPAYDQFFKSKEQSGMSDADWDAYLKRQEQSKNRAQETLDTKVMKELTYRYTEDWKNEKAPMIEEEIDRLSQEPVYSVLNDTTKIPMDRKLVKEFLGVDKIPKQLRGRTVKDGVDPQEYSEVNGFSNPEQMLNEMVSVQPIKEAADIAAQDRMIEKYGDILNDGTIETEAQEAIHNETQAQLLLEELKALKPGRSNKINRDYLKAEAKTLIGSMKFKEIQPNKYYRAEIKAAQKAVTATDKDQQYTHKIQQLANHYMYREAVEVKDRMTKHRKYVKSVQTREYNTKQVNPEYVQNMKVLANLYDLRQKPDQQAAINNILNWYVSQVDDENQFVQLELLDVNLVKALEAKQNNELTEFNLPVFDDLSAQDLQGLNDMLRHLRYVGGVMSDLGKAEFNKNIDDMAESILKNGKSDFKGRSGVARRFEEPLRELSHFVNKIPSLRNLIRKLDGDFKDKADEGIMHKEIFRLVEQANSNKITLNADLHKKFQEILGDIYRVGLTRGGNKTYLLESGLTLDMHNESRFMMAVYWGTETSREAIREGHGMTDADVMAVMSDLTTEQLKMVNKVWEMNETVWPQLSSASVKLLGVAPPKLDSMPFVVKGVELSGGHMRLMYDSSRLDLKAEQDQATKMQTVVPTRAGSTFARVGGGGSPVKLYTSNISQSLEENIHYIAFAESGRITQSLINNPKVKQAIEQKHGTGFYGALIENLEGTISNRSYRETVKTIARISKLLRRAATYKHLCFSIRNTVQQFSSLPVIANEVGVVPVINAMTRIASDTDLIEFINTRSPFMKERASFVNREAAEFLKDLDITNSTQKAYRDFASKGFFMQTAVDSLLAYPAWLATYERQFELHGDDKRASSEANTAVAESVGSGSDLHMGALFQKNQSEFVKIMTLFGSWFNSYYQRVYRSTEGWSTADMETVKALFMTPLITAVMASLLVMDYPDGDSDEAWYKWMTKRYLSFMGGTMPFIRDIVGSFGGYSPKTLVGGGQETPFRLYGEIDSFINDKQTGFKTTSDITKIVTTIVPVPGIGNVTRVMDFIDSDSQGGETGGTVKKTYQAIVEGKDKN